MNEPRFIELLSAFGADLSRWPEEERGAAEMFLDAAPHRIKDYWESERSFDHLLALEKDAPVSISFETAVLSGAPNRRAAQRAFAFARTEYFRQWATGGALAASLAVGFAVGYSGEPVAGPESDYANMLTVSGGGAGSVFLTAMNDGGN